MTKEELVAKLVGATYENFVCRRGNPPVLTSEITAEAKRHGLVIVYGASDDLMEFHGAIDDEIGAYNGTTAYIIGSGLLKNDCNDEACPYFLKLQESANTIEACWDQDGYSWTFKTDIPHVTFEITEDGEKYCRGIVFELADA